MNSRISKLLATAATAVAIGLPLAAEAAVPGETQLRGTITALNGKYDVHVQERNGSVDDVMLHAGTIINPTGLTLKPGVRVTILGNPSGDTFNANEIDTPYHTEYVPPVSYWDSGPYWGGAFYPGRRFGAWF